jgi:hypothetical protein
MILGSNGARLSKRHGAKNAEFGKMALHRNPILTNSYHPK